MYSSIKIPIILTVEDANDNNPEFSQNTYYGSVDQLFSNSSLQKIIGFSVTDQDSGRYGVPGLKCFLLGDQNEKLIISIILAFNYNNNDFLFLMQVLLLIQMNKQSI